MAAQTIGSLFASDIRRRIEEVIKVDQVEEEILRDEIREYVTTSSIKKHYLSILDRYRETPNKPHEGIGVWVSGFFGSGKSSFAKLLGPRRSRTGRSWARAPATCSPSRSAIRASRSSSRPSASRSRPGP